MKTENFECKDVPLNELKSRIAGKFDLFICAASYEERCLSAPMALRMDSFENVLILKNDDVAKAGNENSRLILNHFGNNASVLEITKSVAIRTADRISKEIASHGDLAASRVCIDTTCMTHETLLILFSLLAHMFEKNFGEVLYLYCPAKEYDPGTPYEDKWLSRGIKDVRSVLGYPGKLLPSRKNRLVVFVGFEVNRANGLISVYEPASLGLGYGDGTLNPEHQVVNEQKHLRLSRAYPSADIFEFSPSDPYIVRDIIVDDANNHSEFNLIIAPMNSKISTIGAALATLEKPEIQLCYAPASIYNFDNYSEPDDNCLIFRI